MSAVGSASPSCSPTRSPHSIVTFGALHEEHEFNLTRVRGGGASGSVSASVSPAQQVGGPGSSVGGASDPTDVQTSSPAPARTPVIARTPTQSSIRTIRVRPATSPRGSEVALSVLDSAHGGGEDPETLEGLIGRFRIVAGIDTTLDRRPSGPYAHRPSVSRSGINSTLRRVPESARRSLLAMPDGVLLQIFAHLSSRELCAVTRTSRRVSSIASHNALWQVRCGFMQREEVSRRPDLVAQLRTETRLKHRYLLYRLWAIDTIESNYREQKVWIRQRRLMYCLHLFDSSLLFLLIGVFLVIGFALTARHLTHTRAVGPLSAMAVWPYLVVIGIGVAVTCAVCVARCDSRRAGPRQWCDARASFSEPGEDGVIRAIMSKMLMNDDSQIVVVGCITALVAAWAVLFVLRIASWIGWSYYYVFTPLFTAFGIVAVLCWPPLYQRMRWQLRPPGCIVLWLTLLGPLLVFAALVCRRLDNGAVLAAGASAPDAASFSWMLLLTPLLFIKLCFCCASVGMSCEERSVAPLIAILFCWGPLLAFEVLLAYWLDRGGFDAGDSAPSFAHVLVPLWIFMALCITLTALTTLCCSVGRPDAILLQNAAREPLLL